MKDADVPLRLSYVLWQEAFKTVTASVIKAELVAATKFEQEILSPKKIMETVAFKITQPNLLKMDKK
jgi:mannitol/fructose-specific phosphotransferase system IIA component (Ntr-type)